MDRFKTSAVGALAAAAALFTVTAANAAVIATLNPGSPTANGDGTFTYTYSGTLSGDAGLMPGDELVIFDFNGYVAGSVAAPLYPGLISATTSLTNPELLQTPGQVDNPTIPNLVFTYIGAPFQVSGGPFAPSDFNNLTARSIFNSVTLDTFGAMTTKNNPPGIETGTKIFDQGFISVPAVPETATWAMMILGMGMVGMGLRMRRRIGATLA
jgi:hypothetical protein